MRVRPPSPFDGDFFRRNREQIARANAYLLKRLSLCAWINMAAMSAACVFLPSFAKAAALYWVSALLTGGFCVYAHFWLDRQAKAVLPLFYLLLAGMCAYSVALSCFYYPLINGVTIIGIFMLIPMVLLDRAWRVNLIFFCYYLACSAFAYFKKPFSLAVEDIVTSGAFMVFGMLIGNYLRAARLTAIEQQRQLEFQRDMDVLTCLPNRRLLFETLSGIGQNGEPFLAGVLMIDIDNFKSYNDRNGHQAGDECLRRLGELFLRFSSETGVTIYRYGGEEFLGLWRAGMPLGLDELACRLIQQVRNCAIPGESVTVSIGCARRNAFQDVSTERLISMADAALYEAKRQGRNCAVSCQSSDRDDQPPKPAFRRIG